MRRNRQAVVNRIKEASVFLRGGENAPNNDSCNDKAKTVVGREQAT